MPIHCHDLVLSLFISAVGGGFQLCCERIQFRTTLLLVVMALLSPSGGGFLLLPLLFTLVPLLKAADRSLCRCCLSVGHLCL